MAPSPDPRRTLDRISALPVRIPDRRSVLGYLRLHPDMAGLTERLCTRARERFTAGDDIVLAVEPDPEIRQRTLSILVRRDDYEPDFLESLTRMADEVAGAYTDRSGWVDLTSDFAVPGSPVAV